MSAAGFVLAFAPGRGAEGASIAVGRTSSRLVDGRWSTTTMCRLRRTPLAGRVDRRRASPPSHDGRAARARRGRRHRPRRDRARPRVARAALGRGRRSHRLARHCCRRDRARVDDRGGNLAGAMGPSRALAFDAATGRLKLAKGSRFARACRRAIEHPETCAMTAVPRRGARVVRRRRETAPKPPRRRRGPRRRGSKDQGSPSVTRPAPLALEPRRYEGRVGREELERRGRLAALTTRRVDVGVNSHAPEAAASSQAQLGESWPSAHTIFRRRIGRSCRRGEKQILENSHSPLREAATRATESPAQDRLVRILSLRILAEAVERREGVQSREAGEDEDPVFVALEPEGEEFPFW